MAFTDRVEFTKEMKKEGYTILAPNMAPIHFRLFENLFASYGYNVEILQTRGRQRALWPKGIAGGALRIVVPVAPLSGRPDGRCACLQRRGDLGLVVAGEAQPHRHHRIHTREVDVAALLSGDDVLPVNGVQVGHRRAARHCGMGR